MSDTTVTILVAGVIQIVGLFTTFILAREKMKADNIELKTKMEANAKILSAKVEDVKSTASDLADKVDNVVVKVEQVHLSTNSMKDQLVEATRSDSFQKGQVAGVQEEKERTK